ncbi:MAG: cytochrome c oxidase subunit 3 [Chloroflexi bacterium]|nr:cytochrome c oxidase subunit 3 [Chloroflexota bacterium]MCY3583240.1 cytochrome c oxidase subunit 3 [Chloroflexota bacterium]MCY3717340.1 cytochrome c oxidase subunit 3 [Chloroflexota bacterium]MDE2651294.1 cytochrome c oxidase subunit 3 [Chloroflexota bacterium]MXV93828.1 heme-copper oxidase subunit III [Chloroflexota bacterium]
MTSISHGQKPKPRDQQAAALRLKNNRLGMNIFQASWIMAFFALIVVNWQLRYSYAQWPPMGVQPFELLLPSLATLALVSSTLLVQRGLVAFRGAQRSLFSLCWRLAMALGSVFMVLIAREFATVSQAALATQYGLTMRLMTGFHFVHALVILCLLLVVYRRAVAGAYHGGEAAGWAVEGAAKLWHFVTVAWVLFYVVLYWLR